MAAAEAMTGLVKRLWRAPRHPKRVSKGIGGPVRAVETDGRGDEHNRSASKPRGGFGQGPPTLGRIGFLGSL